MAAPDQSMGPLALVFLHSRCQGASIMTLRWEIDPEQRLVTAVAEGNVTRAEFDAFLDALCQAQAHGYRKLFDGKRGATRMEAEDIMALGARMRASHDKGPVGALAAVVPNEHVEAVGRVLGMLAAAQRPMRVFRQLGPARRWIKGQPGSPMARP